MATLSEQLQSKNLSLKLDCQIRPKTGIYQSPQSIESWGVGSPLGAMEQLKSGHYLMTNWRPDFNPDHLYFITTKAVDYTHLFRRDVIKRLLVDALDCLRLRNQLTLFAFVIMPNHIHLIVQCPAEKPVKDLVRDYKRHVADRLIRQYQVEDKQKVLNFLQSKVNRPDKQKYKVWEDGYNAKNIFSPGFLLQKVDYIHNNPCQSHWGLVKTPEEYIWSSACFYLTDRPAIIPVSDARELMV